MKGVKGVKGAKGVKRDRGRDTTAIAAADVHKDCWRRPGLPEPVIECGRRDFNRVRVLHVRMNAEEIAAIEQATTKWGSWRKESAYVRAALFGERPW